MTGFDIFNDKIYRYISKYYLVLDNEYYTQTDNPREEFQLNDLASKYINAGYEFIIEATEELKL